MVSLAEQRIQQWMDEGFFDLVDYYTIRRRKCGLLRNPLRKST